MPFQLNESDSHVDLSENFARERVVLEFTVLQAGEDLPQDSIDVKGVLSNVSVYDLQGSLAYSVEEIENVSAGKTTLSEARWNLWTVPQLP